MDGNLFRTHAADTLFNLVTIATGQGIQTIGVPTEGIFTPHIHDRVLGLQNVDYVFNAARDLGEEIEFKRGGIIQTRAQEVLAGAHELLERIAEDGPVRGDRRRRRSATSAAASTRAAGSRASSRPSEGYFNPVVELMREAQLTRRACLGRSTSARCGPYADHLGDGLVQMSFTLPVPYSLAARKAALELAAKMGFEEPEVVHYEQLTEGYTYFVMYGRCVQTRRLRLAAGRGLRHRVHERGRDRALRRRSTSAARSSSSARAPARTRTASGSTRCST